MAEFDEEDYNKKLEPIWRTPMFFSLITHPQRDDFLFVTNEVKGTPLPFLRTKDGKIKQLSNERKGTLLSLHSEKPLVVFKQDSGGNENYTVNIFDFSKDQVQQITKNPIGNISDIYWIDDENLLVIGFNNEHYFISRINLNGQMVDLYTTDEQILNSHFNKKENLLAVAIGRRFTKIVLIDIVEAKVKRRISYSEDSSCSYPAFSNNGQLAFASDQQKDHDELIIQSLENPEEEKRISVPGYTGIWPFDQEAIQWIGEDKLIAYVGKNGRVSLFLLEILENKWTEILPESLSLDKARITSEEIVWCGSSLKQPQTIQMYKDGKNTKLFVMGEKELDIKIESLWYETYDGRKIQGWLLKNPNPNAPLLIYCHGGPTYAIINNWHIYVNTLAVAGFNVFAPNFRGSTTFGSEFKDLNIEEFGKGDVKDVLFGAKYVKELLGYDNLPLIIGASHGGFLTLQALTTQPDEWLGGASLVPMADLVEAYELANSHYKNFLIHFFGGTPQEKLDLYKECSPITHVANLKKPLYIYHGANDARCPVSSVRKFHAEAEKRNLPVKLVVAGDEGHGSKNIKGTFDVLKQSVKHLWSLL